MKTKYNISTEEMLIDKSQLLTMKVPEMTALVGGMRVPNANFGHTQHEVFTTNPGALTNDLFSNLLDFGAT